MAVKKEIPIELIEKIKKSFLVLPVKQPATKLLQDALEELKPTLQAAIQKGYSRADLLEMLAKQGLQAKQYHLKSLFAGSQKVDSKE